MSPFPSQRGRTIIEVCYLKGHPPFICGVDGAVADSMLADIEQDLIDHLDPFDKGSGCYLFKPHWESPQIGDEGRVELPGYWDLEPLGFEPMEEPPAGDSEPAPF